MKSYHDALKALADKVGKLTFSIKHNITKADGDNPSAVNVEKRILCNGMLYDDFESDLVLVSVGTSKSIGDEFKKRGHDHKVEVLEIIISLEQLKNNLFSDDAFTGDLYTTPEKNLMENEAFRLGAIEYNSITPPQESHKEFFRLIEEVLTTLKKNLTVILIGYADTIPPASKLRWNVTPALLGGLIQELERKGWIAIPLTNGDVSYSKLADICATIFDFDGKPRSLYNAINEKVLSDTKRAKINLPAVQDLL